MTTGKAVTHLQRAQKVADIARAYAKAAAKDQPRERLEKQLFAAMVALIGASYGKGCA